MAIFKCKMCGGDLEISEGLTVAECEYCGTKQTVPTADNEKKLTLFGRANRLRVACEFDKAAGVFENIVAEFPEEAEAYWGLVLCKYGIEYVDDPATGKKIPTCHRSSFDSIMDDSDLEQALENADASARKIYREEAKAIEEIRKGIIAVSADEEPYDIFICYKETDVNGDRTLDSVLAQDVYDMLVDKGYRVFFSRVTLEDKLGVEYEPYIFAALNSAKIMLAFGTDYEYFNAVWVKNEWSRYLKLMAKDKDKHLIPCYKGIDAYDMPKEFAKLQSQDLGKVGALQDLMRGITKILPKQVSSVTTAQKPELSNGAMVMRGQFALDDGDWEKADEFFERALDENPEDAKAYIGKVLVDLRVSSVEQLKDLFMELNENKNFERAIRFSTGADKAQLEVINEIVTRKRLARRLAIALTRYSVKQECVEGIYAKALKNMEIGTEEAYKQAAEMFKSIGGHRDAAVMVEKCCEYACEAAEKEKNRLEDEKAKCNALLKEYITAVRCEQNLKDKKEAANNKLDSLNREYNTLARLKEVWKNIEDELSSLDEKSKSISNEITPLEEERSNLGLFAGKRKKEIAERISVLESERQKISQSIALTQKRKNGYSSLAAVEDAVSSIAQQIERQKNLLDEVSSVRSSQTIRSELSGFAVGKKLLRKPDAVVTKDIVSAGGGYHTVGLKSDGTVVATGYNESGQCSVNGWRDIIAVSASLHHTVGLKADGTVVATGYNESGQCSVNGWRDIIAVSAADEHTVGLKSDGTVVAIGKNDIEQCNVSDWRDIIAVSAGDHHTVGLKADGTVVAIGKNDIGQCNVSDWRDIIAVSAGSKHTAGLKSDGTVVATGDNKDRQCNITGWRDIIAVSAGSLYTIGLKSDYTVVATGYNSYGQCKVTGWRDIIAVSAGGNHTVGLKSDGTVVATGDNYYGQCKVTDWRLQTALDRSLHPRLLSAMDRF